MDMEERSSHLTIVVGASTIAEDLRRSLVRRRVAHAGVTTHLRGLRKSLVLGQDDLVVVCIALDRPTLTRHGEAVRRLLVDHRCLPKTVRSVGLLSELGLPRDVAVLGCDVYVHDSRQATSAIRALRRRWQLQQRVNAKSTTRGRSALRKPPSREAWLWGKAKLPLELESMVGTGLHPAPTAKVKGLSARRGPSGRAVRNGPWKRSSTDSA